ncbi:hypothetical protein PROFUN_09260 [Planoprotostelium fungivorum]|uniref:Uncharacterized protein n=1 Tax=Planoprotostelium fungivorum TaxID=1890364 RepID=A0A2P6NKV1_9EUKA|nr:hypothetical protein PROFUN_09260 [Planoprotostelium fungivorum]
MPVPKPRWRPPGPTYRRWFYERSRVEWFKFAVYVTAPIAVAYAVAQPNAESWLRNRFKFIKDWDEDPRDPNSRRK